MNVVQDQDLDQAHEDCTYETCDALILNQDNIYVCSITGKCFYEMICENNQYDYRVKNDYVKKQFRKKDQQVNNSKITIEFIQTVIKSLPIEPIFFKKRF